MYLAPYQFITNDTAVYVAASFIAMSIREAPPAPLVSLLVQPITNTTQEKSRQKKRIEGKLTQTSPTGHSPRSP